VLQCNKISFPCVSAVERERYITLEKAKEGGTGRETKIKRGRRRERKKEERGGERERGSGGGRDGGREGGCGCEGQLAR